MPAMRRIGVVTVARSDYGVCRPLLRAIAAADDLELVLIAGGMHLDPALGDTLGEILADGFVPAARVACSPEEDTPAGLARAMGRGTAGFAAAYEGLGLDLLVVLGDRFEMHAAAVAALPFLIPVVQIAGGALTYGAIDDALRHSMTKLTSLHFVETEPYAARVVQMGEAPERVHITGALGLDNVKQIELLAPDELDRRFGLALENYGSPLLVTFHPVTRDFANTRRDAEALLAAVDEISSAHGLPLVFTYPNADTQGRVIVELIEAFAAARPRVRCVAHLGTQGYFSLMALAAAMAGNSSSGIIEAASFRLPVVDIGRRQKGRLAPANVIHTGPGQAEIRAGLAKALDPIFRKSLENLENPYGDGQAAPRMVEVLRQVDLADPTLIQKPFHDLPRG